MNDPPDHDLPLVSFIRRQRQFTGARGLTQAELAYLTGLSVRQVRRLEQSTQLAPGVLTLLRVALALDVAMSDLLDPMLVDLERRRLLARRDARKRAYPTASPP